jgi:nickel-dependent lactate racemase
MNSESAKMELIKLCPLHKISVTNHWSYFNKKQTVSYVIEVVTNQNKPYIKVQAGSLAEAMNQARQAIFDKTSGR